MPANVSSCIPVRVKMRLQAAMLWAILSIPSILVTIILFISTNKSEFNKVSTMHMCCIKKKYIGFDLQYIIVKSLPIEKTSKFSEVRYIFVFK